MMRLNKRGQALVEFVIILPIFVMFLFCIIDIGKIIFMQNRLEGKLDDAVVLYKEDNTYDDILKSLKKDEKKVELEIGNDNNEYVEITLKEDIDIITPGLNLVLGNPYKVIVKRVIYYDKQ